MMQNWFLMAILSTAISIPIYLAIGFFNKNYHIKADIFIVWYFLGVVIAGILLRETPLEVISPSWKILSIITLIGILLGGVGNILLFRSFAIAPNPGLVAAIAGSSSVGIYFLASLLAKLFPLYFNIVKVDIWSFIGLILTILGVSIISLTA